MGAILGLNAPDPRPLARVARNRRFRTGGDTMAGSSDMERPGPVCDSLGQREAHSLDLSEA
jgi:hypothetical protein